MNWTKTRSNSTGTIKNLCSERIGSFNINVEAIDDESKKFNFHPLDLYNPVE